DPVAQLRGELALEFRRAQRRAHAFLEPRDRGHQRLRDVTTPERPEAARRIRKAAGEELLQKPFAFLALDLHRSSSQAAVLRAAARIDNRFALGEPCRGLARACDEFRDTRGILLPGRAFHAARDVDAPR